MQLGNMDSANTSTHSTVMRARGGKVWKRVGHYVGAPLVGKCLQYQQCRHRWNTADPCSLSHREFVQFAMLMFRLSIIPAHDLFPSGISYLVFSEGYARSTQFTWVPRRNSNPLANRNHNSRRRTPILHTAALLRVLHLQLRIRQVVGTAPHSTIAMASYR